MPSFEALWIILGLSLIFSVLTAWDYFSNDHQLTIVGRNRRRVALIFGAVAVFLVVMR
jgi:hypothetical protein